MCPCPLEDPPLPMGMTAHDGLTYAKRCTGRTGHSSSGAVSPSREQCLRLVRCVNPEP